MRRFCIALVLIPVLAWCVALAARAGEPSPAGTQLAIPLSPVQFEPADQKFTDPADRIVIDAVWCSDAAKMEPGETCVVRGHYTLGSRDEAAVALFITVDARTGAGRSLTDSKQQTMIKKGSGEFELRTKLSAGRPHVSFYPAGGGSDLGGVYFRARTTPAH